MKYGLKQVAVAAVLAFGAISALPATVYAQLSPALQQQVNDALAGSNALNSLNSLMTSNPAAAAAIAGAAARSNNGLAAGLATRLATVVSRSRLSEADKAAQIQNGAQALAGANQAAAVDVFNNMAAAAPAFLTEASAGAQAGAPNAGGAIQTAFNTVLANTETAGGGTAVGGTTGGNETGSGRSESQIKGEDTLLKEVEETS